MDTAPISGAGPISGIDQGPANLQLMFARLLSLAESSKSSAMGYIQDIQKTEEEQKQVSGLLQQARQPQADAKSSGTSTAMPAEMVKYMDANKLAYDKTGNDTSHDKDPWETAITSLQAQMDSLGTDTQQKMVFVQEDMDPVQFPSAGGQFGHPAVQPELGQPALVPAEAGENSCQ
jgi:hypothetical protein